MGFNSGFKGLNSMLSKLRYGHFSAMLRPSFVKIAQLKLLAVLHRWVIALQLDCYASLGYNDWAQVLNG